MKINPNFKFLHFSFDDFTLVKFQNAIMKNFKLNTTYSILVKISSENNLIFKMCGPQIGLILKNQHDLDYYSQLYKVILTRIETTVDLYNYMDTIDGLEIMYSVIIPQEELKLKNISEYSLNKQVINIKEARESFNQNLLPLTIDTSYYGFNIINEEREKYINLINNNINLSKCHKVYNLNDYDNLFLFTPPNKNKKYIVISKKLDEKNYIRNIFDLNTGIFIKNIKDTIIKKYLDFFF